MSQSRRPLAFVVIMALFLSGVFYAPEVFAKDPPPINSHYNCTKSVDGRDLKIAEIIKVKNSKADGSDYCPVLSHPAVVANNTPHSVCGDIEKNKVSLLEPSGLTYDSKNGIWVGVSDNYNDLVKCKQSEYTVFYFDATATPTLKTFKYNIKGGGTDTLDLWVVEVQPLLTIAQTDEFKPNDLEGIEYDKGSETFYMTGSLGKHASKPSRDTWERYKVYQFKVQKNGSNYKAIGFKNPFTNWGRDFRDWILSNSGINWGCKNTVGSSNCYTILDGVVTGRPETQGGLNIEALAIPPGSSPNNLSLLFGLRGPVFEENRYGFKKIFATFLNVSAASSENMPKLVDQLFIKTKPSKDQKSTGFGLRGMTLLESNCFQGVEIYAVILGATDREHDQLKAGLIKADPVTGIFNWKGNPKPLPEGFVGEGIAVRSGDIDCSNPANVKIKALLVDDLNAHALALDFTYTP